jgi:hypothetical protein
LVSYGISCFAFFATLIFCLPSLLRHIATRRHRAFLDGGCFLFLVVSITITTIIFFFIIIIIVITGPRAFPPPSTEEKCSSSVSRDGRLKMYVNVVASRSPLLPSSVTG